MIHLHNIHNRLAMCTMCSIVPFRLGWISNNGAWYLASWFWRNAGTVRQPDGRTLIRSETRSYTRHSSGKRKASTKTTIHNTAITSTAFLWGKGGGRQNKKKRKWKAILWLATEDIVQIKSHCLWIWSPEKPKNPCKDYHKLLRKVFGVYFMRCVALFLPRHRFHFHFVVCICVCGEAYIYASFFVCSSLYVHIHTPAEANGFRIPFKHIFHVTQQRRYAAFIW